MTTAVSLCLAISKASLMNILLYLFFIKLTFCTVVNFDHTQIILGLVWQ